jgi:hypothetical protein
MTHIRVESTTSSAQYCPGPAGKETVNIFMSWLVLTEGNVRHLSSSLLPGVLFLIGVFAAPPPLFKAEKATLSGGH